MKKQNNQNANQNANQNTNVKNETTVLISRRGWKLVRFPNGMQNIYSTIFREYLLDEPVTHIWANTDNYGETIFHCIDRKHRSIVKIDIYGRTVF